MDPIVPCTGSNNALGTQNDAVLLLVGECGKLLCHLGRVKCGCGLRTAADEHLVGVVMMSVVMVVTVVVTVVATVASTRAMLVVGMVMVMVMMLMLMMVLVTMALLSVLVVVMVMLVVMIVASARAMLVVVMVVMLMLALVLVMMLVAMALLAILMVMMVVMLGILGQAGKLGLQGVAALHSLQKLCAREISPRGGDDHGGGIVLAQDGDGSLDLMGGYGIGVREDDAGGMLYLITEELTEILHIHLTL